jgi:hypothetical protein
VKNSDEMNIKRNNHTEENQARMKETNKANEKVNKYHNK